MQASGCALLQRIGLSYIISHSAGTVIPLVMSDLCPELVAGAVNLEPDNTPFQLFFPAAVPIDPWGLSEIPVAYDPPVKDPSVDLIKVKVGVDRPGYYACQLQADPPKQYVNISKVPVLVVVGEASIHATWDHCVVNYMRQAGVKVNFTQLGEIGIHGNGHFPFLEKNNLQVAAIIDSWLQNPLTG
jgi:pimeloyl-ACP methyl ester carboxylesterase